VSSSSRSASGSGNKPSSGKRPSGSGNRPASSGKRPSGSGNRPASSGKRPSGSGNRPATRPTGRGSRPSGRGTAIADRQRARQRWTVAAVAAVSVAILAVVIGFAFKGAGDGDIPDGFSADREAFDLPALTGDGHVRLADHRGKPVIVNFFASWCVYCNKELPGFVEVAKATTGQVDFIGVQAQDTGDGVEVAERFDLAGAGFALAKDLGMPSSSKLWSSYGSRGMPVTAFYDSDGKLVDFAGGMLTQEELQTRIEKNFGIKVDAVDAETLRTKVIPLIPQGAAEMLTNYGADGSFVAIDIRTAAEYAAGHIEGAKNVDASAASFDAELAKLSKDTSYIVYDQSGKTSATIAQKMYDLGFKHVYVLTDGLDNWTGEGMPTTR
jgi:rhodanese-related sulfurtransferase/peroxiredoxin